MSQTQMPYPQLPLPPIVEAPSMQQFRLPQSQLTSKPKQGHPRKGVAGTGARLDNDVTTSIIVYDTTAQDTADIDTTGTLTTPTQRHRIVDIDNDTTDKQQHREDLDSAQPLSPPSPRCRRFNLHGTITVMCR